MKYHGRIVYSTTYDLHNNTASDEAANESGVLHEGILLLLYLGHGHG